MKSCISHKPLWAGGEGQRAHPQHTPCIAGACCRPTSCKAPSYTAVDVGWLLLIGPVDVAALSSMAVYHASAFSMQMQGGVMLESACNGTTQLCACSATPHMMGCHQPLTKDGTGHAAPTGDAQAMLQAMLTDDVCTTVQPLLRIGGSGRDTPTCTGPPFGSHPCRPQCRRPLHWQHTGQ